MNPSSEVCQSRRASVSSNSFDNQTSEHSMPLEENKTGCFFCLHITLIKICERWFISLGVVAILFIMIGFFKFTSDKHGETLVFTGVGFLVILSTFMATHHHRSQRQREVAGQIIQRSSDPIYVVTFPADQVASSPSQSPLIPSHMLHSESLLPFQPQWQSTPFPKPTTDDPPPAYEDVASPPPPYESLHLSPQPS